MKTSARSALLPQTVEDALIQLGERISLARRARDLSQADLAQMAGISLSTLRSIESGSAGVQIGYVLTAVWALGLEGTFEHLSSIAKDVSLSESMAANVPLRVRPKGLATHVPRAKTDAGEP